MLKILISPNIIERVRLRCIKTQKLDQNGANCDAKGWKEESLFD